MIATPTRMSCLLLWAVMPGCVLAQALSTAREIASHVTPKDGQPLRVALEATVTFQDPSFTIFLSDETGVTFIRASKDNPVVSRGERLRIEGETHTGLIIGGIKPSRIERLGIGAPVKPRDVTPDELASGRWHYHWASLSGVARRVTSDDENTATMRMNVAGKVVEVRFDEAPPDAGLLVDAELRITGLAAGDINDRRQLVTPYLRVGSMSDVEILKPPPAEPFAVPVVPLAGLQQASAGAHRVKIQGVALGRAQAGGIFLRELDRSVFVQTHAPEVAAGDVVEALGFPEMGVFSAQLSDAECRVLSRQDAPAPLAVTSKELANGTDAELITLAARVLQRSDQESHTELMAEAGGVTLSVVLPNMAAEAVQADSQVQITGLCLVTATRSDGYRARPTSCRVWVQGDDDLALLQAAPWWTSQRLAIGFGSVAALASVAFLWAALLRRQVGRQLDVIHAKAQREAIAEERQRIAREFHDTLEQELAGLSLRLDAATPRVTDEKARTLLEQQRKLLQRLQTETRDFVWDLRDTSRADVPLDMALPSLLEHLQVNTVTPLRFSSKGPAPRLPVLVQHHLMRIAREAVNNALKYSKASSVEVSLEATEGLLTLAVTDEGAGFDVDAALTMEGHFGLRGMMERGRKIGAELQVISAPGKGTRITASLGLPTTQTG